MLTVGAVMIVAGAAVLGWRRRWGEVLRLPAPPANDFEIADLLFGLMAVVLLPGLFLSLFGLWGGVPPVDQSTSAPAEDILPTAPQLFAQVVGQLGATAVLVYLGILRIRGGLSGWGLRGGLIPRHCLAAMLAYIAIWPVCAAMLALTRVAILLVFPEHVLPEHLALQTLHAEDTSILIKTTTVIGALVLAPIMEELFFRGMLQTALAKWWRSPWLAVLFSGCAFGVFHYSVFDTVPALTFFGIALGYAYARTRSLILVIILHAVFNGRSILWIVLGG